MTHVKDYWPFTYQPRLNQDKAFEWLQENKDKKFLILEAPVGSGKSNIGLTYSLFNKNKSYILTPQRILQQQYEHSFQDNSQINLASFYGKSNYQCITKNSNCEIGDLVGKKCKRCPYKINKQRAVDSNNTVMNYKLALSLFAYTSLFDNPRPLMILDECHKLEQHLVAFDTLTISQWKCEKYKIKWQAHNNIKDAVEYIQTSYIPQMKNVIDELEQEVELIKDKDPSDLTKQEINKLQELADLTTHVLEEAISYNNVKHLEQNFVLVYDDTKFEFRRLHAHFAFKQLLEPKADQFLFMSSTILNKERFCADLGINPDDAAFLSLPSEFAIENRPVYYLPQMKMNYSWLNTENAGKRKNMIECIKHILKMYEGKSGIIHTGNFKVAQWLVKHLSGHITQQIYHHNPESGDDRNAIINAFMTSPKPGILISPSSTEGLDLKQELGEFAVFVKIPFGSLADQWIKRRMELSKEWYHRQALIDIVQGGGRIVRGPDDKGDVFILDQSFGYLFSQTKNDIPQWWKDSYQVL